MTEISQEQIGLLKRFLVRHYVRYEDVQLELIDHLASGIEEKMNADSSLTFETALDSIYTDFGVSGFSNIVKEKEKMMVRFWKKHIVKEILAFLRPPVLLITLTIFALLWTIQTYFQLNLFSSAAILTIFGFLFALMLCFKLFFSGAKQNKYLFLKSYNGFVGITLYFTLYLTPSSLINFLTFEASVSISPLSIILGSVFFTFNLILVYILIYAIPKGLLAKMKSQYTQLNIN